jgi:hypothetical protein
MYSLLRWCQVLIAVYTVSLAAGADCEANITEFTRGIGSSLIVKGTAKLPVGASLWLFLRCPSGLDKAVPSRVKLSSEENEKGLGNDWQSGKLLLCHKDSSVEVTVMVVEKDALGDLPDREKIGQGANPNDYESPESPCKLDVKALP